MWVWVTKHDQPHPLVLRGYRGNSGWTYTKRGQEKSDACNYMTSMLVLKITNSHHLVRPILLLEEVDCPAKQRHPCFVCIRLCHDLRVWDNG